MAFERSNAVARETTHNYERAKALGFLNFYRPQSNGTRRKVGAIPLMPNDAYQKFMFETLTEDPSLIAKFNGGGLIVEFQPNTSDPSKFEI